MKGFPHKDSIQAGWNAATGQIGFFAPFLILVFGATIVLGLVAEAAEGSPALMIAAGMVQLFFAVFLNMWMICIALRATKGEKLELKKAFSYADMSSFRNYFIATLLYSVVLIAGFLLFIIPGIILALSLPFYGYLIVDKKLAPVPALLKSVEITQVRRIDLLVFFLFLWVIYLTGILVFFIGTLWAVPTAAVAFAFAYRKLSEGRA